MRAYLLTTTAIMALLAAMPAQAQDANWLLNPGSGNFNTAGNWSPPTVPTGTAFFGLSTIRDLTFNLGAANSVGGFLFNNVLAGAYSFSLLAPLSSLTFTGAGISNFSGNGVQITTSPLGNLVFTNNSTAGTAATTITNNGTVTFAGTSSAGDATIANNFRLFFTNTSTAGNATITTNAVTQFTDNSTAGNAQLITNAGANVLFEFTSGPAGDNQITAGSIAGAGTYVIPGKTLTVGSNNLSTTVSGLIVGAGGSLVKTGSGTLTLSGINSYTGHNDGQRRRAVRGRLDRAIEPDDREQRRARWAAAARWARPSSTPAASSLPVPVRETPGSDDRRRQSRVPVRRALRRAGQSHDGLDHQCERHRLACRHRSGQLRARQLRVAQLHHFDGRGRAHRHVRRARHPRACRPASDETELYRQYRIAQPQRAARSRTADDVAADTGATAGRPYWSCRPRSLAPLPTFTVNQLNVGQCDRQLLQQRRRAAAGLRAALRPHRQQSHQCAGPAFRRSRDRRAEGRIPAHRPVPQPDARSLRRWAQRGRRRRSPGARLCARARQHAA